MQEQAQIREEIAELRANYARLIAMCGPQAVSQNTTENYSKRIKTLLAQLNPVQQ